MKEERMKSDVRDQKKKKKGREGKKERQNEIFFF